MYILFLIIPLILLQDLQFSFKMFTNSTDQQTTDKPASKTLEQEIRQAKERSFQERRRLLDRIPDPGSDPAQHPKIDAKFIGYMTVLKRKLDKQGVTQLNEYYTSSYLTDLKEKRNISFSQDILKKMYKDYSLEEYASNFDKNIYDPTKPPLEQEYYERLYEKARK